jgi:hypothetical protein
MKIVLLITVFEMAALMTWVLYKYYIRNQQMLLAMPANRSQSYARRVDLAPALKESTHYPFINERQLEGQSDDRRPMNGVVASIGETGTPSARAFARRSHQLMYKKWSQERRGENRE